MRWAIVIWLLCAGVGASFSIVRERNRQVWVLKQMERSLEQLVYYMHQWRMPVEEAVRHTAKGENGILLAFYSEILKNLSDRQAEDFGELWQEKGKLLGRQEKIPKEVMKLWCDSFLHIPMEPEALKHRLSLQIEEMNAYRIVLQEKYKGEQKLVMALGFFAGTFICLILW